MPKGRPKKPVQAAKLPRQVAFKPNLKMISVRIGQDDLDALDRIVAIIQARGNLQGNKTQAMRWAIRELDARLTAMAAGQKEPKLSDPPQA